MTIIISESEKQLIQDQAIGLGFDIVRFTDSEPLTKDGKFYQQWLEEGNHADMKWMENGQNKRWQPKAVLASAQSVICLATNYYQPAQEDLKPGFGRVANYAHGRDYHKIVAKKLKRLQRFLYQKWPDSENKAYVDTGPVLEKALAQKAGIGFVGKNTLVISKEFGSWVFLSEIITSLKISPDELLPPYGSCGTCRRCIDACPTGALTEYKLDARKCISYHTIENRGEIPPEIAKNLAGNLFGCDICQQVCPHNCRAQKTKEEAFKYRIAGDQLELSEVLEIKTKEEFDQRFAGSPIRRAKLEGLQRNARLLQKNNQGLTNQGPPSD